MRCQHPDHPMCGGLIQMEPAWPTCVNGHTQPFSRAFSVRYVKDEDEKIGRRAAAKPAGESGELEDELYPEPSNGTARLFRRLRRYNGGKPSLLERIAAERDASLGDLLLDLAARHRYSTLAADELGVPRGAFTSWMNGRGITWASIREAASAGHGPERSQGGG